MNQVGRSKTEYDITKMPKKKIAEYHRKSVRYHQNAERENVIENEKTKKIRQESHQNVKKKCNLKIKRKNKAWNK